MSTTEEQPQENSVTTRYHLYLYDLPKLDAEGRSVPTKPAETRDFIDLEAARSSAAERKEDFDRIVLIKTTGDAQQLVERFSDGAHIPPRSGETVG